MHFFFPDWRTSDKLDAQTSFSTASLNIFSKNYRGSYPTKQYSTIRKTRDTLS